MLIVNEMLQKEWLNVGLNKAMTFCEQYFL